MGTTKKLLVYMKYNTCKYKNDSLRNIEKTSEM